MSTVKTTIENHSPIVNRVNDISDQTILGQYK